MRFGLKIFLMTFTIVVITINIIGINLLNNTFKTNMASTIDKHSANINNIMNSMKYSSAEVIIKSYYEQQIYTKIYVSGSTFSTSFPKDYNDIEQKITNNLENNIINYYINEKLLFMALKNGENTVITVSNIAEIYNIRDNNVNYFIKISLIASFLVAIILSALVSLITYKLKKLNKAANEIAKGNYNIEIPKLGHDEIGEFATTFKQMTNAINNNIKEIKKISENRRIFIGNLTHEIRTPLTSIIGYSSLIKNKKVTDLSTINSYIAKIYDEGKYIENMRDKLMNILILETSKIELKPKNISNLLNKYIKEFTLLFGNSKFLTEIEPNVKKEIDETLFKSLIINLVKNSVNASSTPEIKIILKKDQLYIIDNGKGIPKNELEKIKEPFYTLNKDRNRTLGGMGLGMTLCISIIKIHNWDFKITSIENKGTKIKITFGGLE